MVSGHKIHAAPFDLIQRCTRSKRRGKSSRQTERHWVVMAALEEAISSGRALEIVGDGTDGLSEEAVHENLRDSAVTIIRHEQLMMRHLGKVSGISF